MYCVRRRKRIQKFTFFHTRLWSSSFLFRSYSRQRCTCTLNEFLKRKKKMFNATKCTSYYYNTSETDE